MLVKKSQYVKNINKRSKRDKQGLKAVSFKPKSGSVQDTVYYRLLANQ